VRRLVLRLVAEVVPLAWARVEEAGEEVPVERHHESSHTVTLATSSPYAADVSAAHAHMRQVVQQQRA